MPVRRVVWRARRTMRGPADVGDDEVMADPDVRAVLLAASAVTVVLVAVVVVLGVGRARAWRVVAARTDELRHQALHDTLTDLPNRALIADRLDQVLVRARRDGTTVRRRVRRPRRLQEHQRLARPRRRRPAADRRRRPADVDARARSAPSGGWAATSSSCCSTAATTSPSPELVAGRLLDVIRQPFDLDGPAPLDDHGERRHRRRAARDAASDLLRDAEVALQQAKAAGKDRAETVRRRHADRGRPAHRARVRPPLGRRRRPVHARVPTDLPARRPRASSASRPSCGGTTRRSGRVEPDEFIPILERTGQIRAVGRWVLLEACRQMAAWHATGPRARPVGQRLGSPARPRRRRRRHPPRRSRPAASTRGADRRGHRDGADAGRRRDRAAPAGDQGPRRADRHRRLRHRATRRSPTSSSSRSTASRSTARSRNAISTSKESKALIGTLVQLGRDLGLTTLAEGVETPGEVEHLRRQRVHQVQGHLLSGPARSRRRSRSRSSCRPAGPAERWRAVTDVRPTRRRWRPLRPPRCRTRRPARWAPPTGARCGPTT